MSQNNNGRHNTSTEHAITRRRERSLSSQPPKRRQPSSSQFGSQGSTPSRRSSARREPELVVVANPKRTVSSRRPQQPITGPLAWLVSMVRLGVLGVGVATIAGTGLSIVTPNGYRFSHLSQPARQQQSMTNLSTTPSEGFSALKLTQEIKPLKQKIAALASRNPQLTLGTFLVDLDTGAYVDINGSNRLPTASMIKFPILVAFFQDVDAGKIRLDEKLTMRKDLVATEAGSMQYEKPGSQFTALETATQMIVISDNTATNMLIDRLGGKEQLNQRFQSWGLLNLSISNLLPDLKGTNVAPARDLASLMTQVSQGKLVSMKSRDRLLAIMRQTETNTLLPKGLGAGATIAHKTGDIGSLVGDVGLIDAANGKRYVAVAMVKRPYNDPRAQELIRQLSRDSYVYFNQPSRAHPKPKTQTTPSPTLSETSETTDSAP
jgi:beta-lactamase class A